MRIIFIVFCILVCTFGAVSAFAQDPQVVVIPLNTSRVPTEALPIAYGGFSENCAIITNYGIASCTTSSTGVYNVTLVNPTTGGWPAVFATAYNSIPGAEIVTFFPISDSVIEINISNGSGIPVSSAFSIIVFGNKQ